MSLTVTFLEGAALLLQNISVCVLSDLVCMSCTLLGFSGTCSVNPKALSLEWLQSAQVTSLPSQRHTSAAHAISRSFDSLSDGSAQ